MSDAAEKQERFIVVGVDGSEPSLKALRWAAEQARLTGATLRVVTTWEVPTGTGWVPTFPVDYDPEAVAGQALDEAVIETLGADPDVAVERDRQGGPRCSRPVGRGEGRGPARGREPRSRRVRGHADRLGLRASRAARALRRSGRPLRQALTPLGLGPLADLGPA